MGNAVNIFSDELPQEKFEDGRDASVEVKFSPIDDGTYKAEVVFSVEDPNARWRETGNNPTHFFANLQARLDGNKRAFGLISTRPFRVSKDSEVLLSTADKLLKAVGRTDKAEGADSPVELAQAVANTIGDGLSAYVRTEWRSSCRNCYELGRKNSKDHPTEIRGQKNFPKDEQGNYILEPPCPTCKAAMQPATAEFRVVRGA